jgi:hypothetical protein
MVRIAAVTMAYNEPLYAPLWASHYTGEVGAEHCTLVDHGSDDGSTAGLGINVLRLPRSPQDDPRGAQFISSLCAGLLQWYDAVLCSDIDELLLADPSRFASLSAYAAAMPADVVTAVGLDLHRIPNEDPPSIRAARSARSVAGCGSPPPCASRR